MTTIFNTMRNQIGAATLTLAILGCGRFVAETNQDPYTAEIDSSDDRAVEIEVADVGNDADCADDSQVEADTAAFPVLTCMPDGAVYRPDGASPDNCQTVTTTPHTTVCCPVNDDTGFCCVVWPMYEIDGGDE